MFPTVRHAYSAQDPHFRARHAVQEMADPLIDRTLHPTRRFAWMATSEAVVAWLGPAVGVHNRYVVGELLGESGVRAVVAERHIAGGRRGHSPEWRGPG